MGALSSASRTCRVGAGNLFLFAVNSSTALLEVSNENMLSVMKVSASTRKFGTSYVTSFKMFVDDDLFVLVSGSLEGFYASFSSETGGGILCRLVLSMGSSFSHGSTVCSPCM